MTSFLEYVGTQVIAMAATFTVAVAAAGAGSPFVGVKAMAVLLAMLRSTEVLLAMLRFSASASGGTRDASRTVRFPRVHREFG